MRILYVLPYAPWIVRLRSFHLIPRLARQHSVYLVCRTSSFEEDERAAAMTPYCQVRCVRESNRRAVLRCALALPTPTPLRMAYFASSRMQNAVRQAIAKFSPDVIYAERWRSLQYVPKDVNRPIVCDPTDSMLRYNSRLMRRGSWWEKLVGFEEAIKFRRYEPQLANQASLSLFCSMLELETVRPFCNGAKLAILPNGVDCRRLFLKQSAEEQPNQILFTGSFTYRPNFHAVDHFLRNIYPSIKARVPDARFSVVGNLAQARLKKIVRHARDVKVFDFVPDIRAHIAGAAVCVAPITVGVGITNKVLEAFATGTSVVASSYACGDLPVRDGEHLLLADNPAEFADKVVRLLREPELRRDLASNARRLVEETYDWDVVANRLERLMFDVARHADDFQIAHAAAQNV